MATSQLPGARLANCLICHECDLLVDVGALTEGFRAQCPRCHYTLCNAHRNPTERALVYCVAAFVCLVMSCVFDFMQLSSVGNVRQISLPETVQELFALNEWVLAGFIALIIIALPVCFISALATLLLSIRLRRVTLSTLSLLQFVSFLRFWNMAEIFFLGILISMVKIASTADLTIGTSFWFYGFFNLFMILALAQVDRTQLALMIREQLQDKEGATTP